MLWGFVCMKGTALQGCALSAAEPEVSRNQKALGCCALAGTRGHGFWVTVLCPHTLEGPGGPYERALTSCVCELCAVRIRAPRPGQHPWACGPHFTPLTSCVSCAPAQSQVGPRWVQGKLDGVAAVRVPLAPGFAGPRGRGMRSRGESPAAWLFPGGEQGAETCCPTWAGVGDCKGRVGIPRSLRSHAHMEPRH